MPSKKNLQNYWSFHLSEPFTFGHFNVRHPATSFFVKLLIPLPCHLCKLFLQSFQCELFDYKKEQINIIAWNLKSGLTYRTRVNLSNWSFNSKVAALVGLLLWAKQISWNFLRFLVLYVISPISTQACLKKCGQSPSKQSSAGFILLGKILNLGRFWPVRPFIVRYLYLYFFITFLSSISKGY